MDQLCTGGPFQPDLAGIEGFSGKRLTIGPPGGTSAEYVERIIRLLGIEPAEFINVDWVEGNELLCSGGAEAGATIVGPPQPSVEALLNRGKLRILGFSETSIQKVTKEFPFFFPAEMPPGTYPGQEDPVRTVGIWNLVFCSGEMPENLAFEILRETFKNKSYIEKAHKAAGQFSGKDAHRFPIPLHSGSLRYHRDSGFL